MVRVGDCVFDGTRFVACWVKGSWCRYNDHGPGKRELEPLEDTELRQRCARANAAPPTRTHAQEEARRRIAKLDALGIIRNDPKVRVTS